MVLPEHLRQAIEHYIPKMTGMTTPERCCELAELVIDSKPLCVVEIGVFGGVTMLAQAFALRQNGRGVIYGIDSYKLQDAIEGEDVERTRQWWAGIDFRKVYLEACQAIWDHQLQEWAVLLRARSQDCSWMFPAVDILHIDGAHSEVSSVRDAELYLPLVRPGGYVWMDDCDWSNGTAGTTLSAQKILEAGCDVVRSGQGGKYKLYQKR